MKEKNKNNPFAGMMEGNEEILWLLAQPPITMQRHIQRFLMAWLLVSVSQGLSLFSPYYTIGTSAIGLLIGMGMCLFPICLMFYAAFARGEAKRRAYAYLLTDKNLYVSTPQGGAAFYPLERIHELYPSNSQTILLDVGAPKPVTLKYVKNARAVATLMENARLDRLEELGLYEDDTDEREEQGQSLRRFTRR